MAISAEWRDYPVTFKMPRITHLERTRERGRKLESIHRESTDNLHRQHINLSSSCDHCTEIYRGLDNAERVCETERFPTWKKKFKDGAWCMERPHDRPFQDFVAHETHRLIPPVR